MQTGKGNKMAHINIKPIKRYEIYETPEQAINHVLLHETWSKNWVWSGAFGRTINERRAIDKAIKENNASAFIAHKRRGYWRIELAQSK